MSELTGTAWNFVPLLLILFLFASILMIFHAKNKIDEAVVYLRSIATSLEKLSQRVDPEAEAYRRRDDARYQKYGF